MVEDPVWQLRNVAREEGVDVVGGVAIVLEVVNGEGEVLCAAGEELLDPGDKGGDGQVCVELVCYDPSKSDIIDPHQEVDVEGEALNEGLVDADCADLDLWSHVKDGELY